MFVPMTNRFAFTLVVAVLLPMSTISTSRGRIVQGKVYDSDGTAVNGAAVQLKNAATLSIRSYLTGKDGRYRFIGLLPDHEYELRASFEGHWSPSEAVSRFDSRDVVEMDLKIDISRKSRDSVGFAPVFE